MGILVDAVELPAGQTAIIDLRGRVETSPARAASLLAEANVTAVYVPFHGDGSGGGGAISVAEEEIEEPG